MKLNKIKIKDIMHKKVFIIKKEDPVLKAAKLMASKKISCVIVGDKKNVEGILTERDLVHRLISKQLDPSEVKVKDVMTSKIISIEPEKDLVVASGYLNHHKIKQLPVIKDNKLKGIVTQTNLIHHVNQLVGWDWY